MDSDGFEIQGRKRGGKTREPVRDRDQVSDHSLPSPLFGDQTFFFDPDLES